MSELRTLETLQFDNTFARLPEVFYAKVTPTPLKSPFLVAFNPDAAALLDLDPEEARRPEFAGCFAGHYLPPGSEPLAMVYAGHQFGAYRSEEHTSELQSRSDLVCRLLLEKKNTDTQ